MSKSKRVTVAHCNRRHVAADECRAEEERYPGCNASVTGEPGNWKVRRDRQPSDPAVVICRTRFTF